MMTIGEVVLNSSSVISEPAMGYSFGGSNCCLSYQFRPGEGMFAEIHASDDCDAPQKKELKYC
jgi:hypothetical protein